MTSANFKRLELLNAAPSDSWIALSADEQTLIATAQTYDEVVSASEAVGVADPVILKTPKKWLPLAV